uniref:HIN-200 domain-containing protein n=1 Tax=Peromyscus maniculatus bairdii TaxID=230844 RepID=A0A8C8UC54_PERMB
TSTNNIQQSSSSSGFHTNRNKRSPDHSNTSRSNIQSNPGSSCFSTGRPSKVEGHHRDPIQVMVLKVTEPFTYDLIDGKRMFHATVATETEFFRVKVFDTALKNKFIPQKIIAISDYFGTSGFLEIYGASCVSDVNVNQTMVISNTLRRRANGTPKIKDLFSQTKGTYVNGEFVVTKVNDTGKMEVVVYGRLTSINCEPGNKLRLVCFELTSREDTWQLKSVRHSYILKTVPKQPSEEEGHHQGPKKVMVLKATEPFTYDNRGERWMFHATVATETEFFRVKVFDIDLKEKFIPNNVITISDYVGRNGFINIHSASSVSEVNDNQLMNIPTTLRQRANATPKINDLYSQRRGIFVNGVFMVSKKNEREDFIYYEIQDNTGVMEVVVYGRLTSVDCNPGDKLRLWCFELTSNEDRVQLRSTRHSNMKVCALGEHPPS